MVKRIIPICLVISTMFTLVACSDKEESGTNLIEHGLVNTITGEIEVAEEEEVEPDTEEGKVSFALKKYVDSLTTDEQCDLFEESWNDISSSCKKLESLMGTSRDNSRYEFNLKHENEIPQVLMDKLYSSGMIDSGIFDGYGNVKLIINAAKVNITCDCMVMYPSDFNCDDMANVIRDRKREIRNKK